MEYNPIDGSVVTIESDTSGTGQVVASTSTQNDNPQEISIQLLACLSIPPHLKLLNQKPIVNPSKDSSVTNAPT